MIKQSIETDQAPSPIEPIPKQYAQIVLYLFRVKLD